MSSFLRSLLLQIPLQVPLHRDVVYCVFKAFVGVGQKQFDTWLDDGLPVLLLDGEATVSTLIRCPAVVAVTPAVHSPSADCQPWPFISVL